MYVFEVDQLVFDNELGIFPWGRLFLQIKQSLVTVVLCLRLRHPELSMLDCLLTCIFSTSHLGRDIEEAICEASDISRKWNIKEKSLFPVPNLSLTIFPLTLQWEPSLRNYIVDVAVQTGLQHSTILLFLFSFFGGGFLLSVRVLVCYNEKDYCSLCLQGETFRMHLRFMLI